MFFINIGHLHPLLVHLPIGIVILCFLLEVIFRRKRSEEVNKIISVSLFIGMISSILSLITGWLLGGEGGYSSDAIFLHKWLAVAFSVSVILLCLIQRSTKNALKGLYLPFFIVVLILLTLTGHFGANMTHGESFLFKSNEAELVEIENIEDAKVYADVIRPILANKCVSCHNTGKSNGDLIMSSPTYLEQGGKSGSVFAASGSSDALLLNRIHLPVDEKEHMPPSGKTQLTPNEKDLIEWWMANNHCFDCLVSDLKFDEPLAEVLQSLETDKSVQALVSKKVDDLSSEWLAELNENGISSRKLSEESNLIEVNLSHRNDLSNKEFELLSKHPDQIVELNLGYSNFDDVLSKALPKFTHLINVKFQNTSISNQTVERLSGLEYLESINLYGTSVTNDCLPSLSGKNHLKSLYVWQTDISSDGMADAGLNNVEMIGKSTSALYANSQLALPQAFYSRVLFSDTMHVRLETEFDDAVIYYTVDGSEPDTSALVYNDSPIVLTESTSLNIAAHKAGWDRSEVLSRSFKKIKYEMSQSSLSIQPHENYAGNGASTIIDGIIGTLDFRDGNWVGFQGESPTFIVSSDKPIEISSVSLGALVAQGSWIFGPASINVLVSSDNQTFKKVKTESYNTVTEALVNERHFFDVKFDPIEAKYIKIEVVSHLKNPSWHPSAGEPCYVFLDEIVVG